MESFYDMSFPKCGIDVSMPFWMQQARQMPGGGWGKTTVLGQNVRSYDANNRRRGGSRPGLVKYTSEAVVADWIVQHLNTLVQDTSPGGSVQASTSGRVVTLVAVSQGNIKALNAGDTSWTSPTNNTGQSPPLNFTGVIYSTQFNQKLYFADGVNWVYFDPHGSTIETWAATAGSLPVDEDDNLPRLIATYRGRIVLSGLLEDPQNWFMSAQGEAGDFDYSPTSTSQTQAVAGNNSPQGLIGDTITSLVPYSDDVLIFGGDHTLYAMRGDPMAGGSIDLISDKIGMAWGIPWAKDPVGNVFFVSNKMGIYVLAPQGAPQRISQQIEPLLEEVDTGENLFRMLWDERYQGMHVFCTPVLQPEETTHFFYETRSGAWWTDVFENRNHNPLTCCDFDGNEAEDRVPLIGSWDGYVRALNPTATKDDGYNIASEVVIGPIVSRDMDDIMLKDLQAVLAETSGDVDWAVHVGTSAEAALDNDPVCEGTWTAGRNLTDMVRRNGYAIYVKISSTNAWAMELVRARIASLGKVRRRGS